MSTKPTDAGTTRSFRFGWSSPSTIVEINVDIEKLARKLDLLQAVGASTALSRGPVKIVAEFRALMCKRSRPMLHW